jgi:predicted Fe-S protein YdhL (DUF1289 family)
LPGGPPKTKPGPAQDVARRILGEDVTQEELSDAERDQLLKLCRQRARERDRVQRKLRNSSSVMPMSLAI